MEACASENAHPRVHTRSSGRASRTRKHARTHTLIHAPKTHRAAGQRVTFFMRKGADLLSKWVGEAERQLRLLFEEAARQQPAIIFFDEV